MPFEKELKELSDGNARALEMGGTEEVKNSITGENYPPEKESIVF